MRTAWLAVGLILIVLAASAGKPRRTIECGADLSSLPQVEAGGGTFRDADTVADAMTLLRRHGFTSVRLRLWHTPAAGDCDLAATLAMARRAHSCGMRVLLDLHYSDTWADPGHQNMPAAWHGLAMPVLADSVRTWTRDVLRAFEAQGTPPAWVQLGNEIDAGLMWDAGRIDGSAKSRRAAAQLLRAAAVGAREGSPRVRRMIHLAEAGHTASALDLLDALDEQGVDWEIAAFSYYPWWHGPTDGLARTLRAVASRYRCEVAVVETAYPWTARWFDGTHNVVDGTKVPNATPEGQRAHARAVRAIVAAVPDGRGLGVWWWEGAWIATPRFGSPWENAALFDSAGALLPAADALSRATR